MSAKYWRASAYARINQVISNTVAEGVNVWKMTEEQKANFKKSVDAAYPFGDRAYYPYKIWLEVRAETFAKFGIATKRKPRTIRSGRTCIPEGQLKLF